MIKNIWTIRISTMIIFIEIIFFFNWLMQFMPYISKLCILEQIWSQDLEKIIINFFRQFSLLRIHSSRNSYKYVCYIELYIIHYVSISNSSCLVSYDQFFHKKMKTVKWSFYDNCVRIVRDLLFHTVCVSLCIKIIYEVLLL